MTSVVGGRGFNNLLIQFDEVLIIRQLETLDAGGQARDGFVFAKRIERPGLRAVFIFVIIQLTAEEDAILGHGLHAELLA